MQNFLSRRLILTQFSTRFLLGRGHKIHESGTRSVEKPTFVSSGPDAYGRTVCFGDELSRRARYGRIRPMPTRSRSIFGRLARLIAR
jgi:hypothetical protein